MRTQKTCLAITLTLLLSPGLAVAQTTVEQTIQIAPGGGGGGSIQLPGMMGGPRTFKTGTGRIRGRVLASDGPGPSVGRRCASPAPRSPRRRR